MRTTRRRPVIIAIAFAVGCGWVVSRGCEQVDAARIGARTEPATAGLVDAQRAIDLGNRSYVAALVHKDPIAFGALFSDDAVSLPSRAPIVRGRDAIVASIRDVFAHMTFESGTLHTIETHLQGDTAYEVGSYTFDVVFDQHERELRGRYLVIWHRVGGTWKIGVDSSQPDAPAS